MKLNNLTTNFLGRNILYYKSIPSTQNKMWELINEIPSGTIIVADVQTQAIGTRRAKMVYNNS